MARSTKFSRNFAVLAAAAATIALSSPALADVKAGVDAWERGEFAKAVEEWRDPAAKGDADAQFNLGQAYKLGRGVPMDLKQACQCQPGYFGWNNECRVCSEGASCPGSNLVSARPGWWRTPTTCRRAPQLRTSAATRASSSSSTTRRTRTRSAWRSRSGMWARDWA